MIHILGLARIRLQQWATSLADIRGNEGLETANGSVVS
jgi:hypothetical protein